MEHAIRSKQSVASKPVKDSERGFNLDFACIGATKSGTTWLAKAIAQHPEINASLVKEPCYFSLNYDRHLDWYRKYWNDVPGIKGEFTAHYMYYPKALTRLRRDFPEARLVVILRNPIERAMSHLLHWIREEKFDISAKPQIDAHSDIVTRSLYFEPLHRIYDAWPHEQIKVVFHDTLVSDPGGLVGDVFEFLEVDKSFEPKRLQDRAGAAYVPAVSQLETARRMIYEWLASHHLHGLIRMPIVSNLDKAYKMLNGRPANELTNSLRHLVDAHSERIRLDVERLYASSLPLDRKPLRKWLESAGAVR